MAQKELKPAEKKEARTAQPEEIRGLPFFSPHVDIYETESSLTIVADMPGVEGKNVTIDLKEDVLTLHASVTQPLEEKLTPLYREYREGNYYRQFMLSEIIDQEKISAEISQGVLRLTLPKSDRARARKIKVKGA